MYPIATFSTKAICYSKNIAQPFYIGQPFSNPRSFPLFKWPTFPGFLFMVHVYIGTLSSPFQIHKNLITYHSPYFNTEFQKDLGYLNGAQVLTFEADDKYVDHSTFGLFVNWLYTQKIQTSEGKKLNLIQYTKLYLLFTHFMMPSEAKQMMTAIEVTLAHHDAKDNTLVPFQKLAFSHEDDKLRDLACYKTAQHMDWYGIEEIVENMPPEMVGAWTVFLMRNCCALKGWTKGHGFAVFEMKKPSEIPGLEDEDNREVRFGEEEVSEEKVDDNLALQWPDFGALLNSRNSMFGGSNGSVDKAVEEEKENSFWAFEADPIRRGFGQEDVNGAEKKSPKKKTVEKGSVVHHFHLGIEEGDDDVNLEFQSNLSRENTKRWIVQSSDDEEGI